MAVEGWLGGMAAQSAAASSSILVNRRRLGPNGPPWEHLRLEADTQRWRGMAVRAQVSMAAYELHKVATMADAAELWTRSTYQLSREGAARMGMQQGPWWCCCWEEKDGGAAVAMDSRRRRFSALEPFLVEKEEQARRSRQVNGEEDSRRHSVYHCNQPRRAGAAPVHCFHAARAS